jgi:plasmid stabilization system protein ParE
MELNLTPELEAKLARNAAQHGRNPADLVQDVLTRYFVEIRWSLPAAADMERICEHIESDNPEASRRVARTIYEGCTGLKTFPRLGRPSIRMPGRRELVFPPLPTLWFIR